MTRCHELKAQLDESLANNQALREQLRVSEVEFSATKSDAEGMLKVISQLEKQCAELQDAENRAKMAEDGAGASMQTLAVERDQAVAKEAQARRQVLNSPACAIPRRVMQLFAGN
jgi:predicted nuclease with TOPRIM domain